MSNATQLHEPISAEPWDEVDWRRCSTCGTDLYDLAVCPNTPIAECGCPEYAARDNDHWVWGCEQ